LAAIIAGKLAGSSTAAVKLFGPDQAKEAYGRAPPRGVEVSVIRLPSQTGLLTAAVMPGQVTTLTVVLFVPVQPLLSVTVTW